MSAPASARRARRPSSAATRRQPRFCGHLPWGGAAGTAVGGRPARTAARRRIRRPVLLAAARAAPRTGRRGQGADTEYRPEQEKHKSFATTTTTKVPAARRGIEWSGQLLRELPAKLPAPLSRDFSVGAAVGPIRGARAGWDGRLRQPVRCRVEPVARACDEQPANPPLSA